MSHLHILQCWRRSKTGDVLVKGNIELEPSGGMQFYSFKEVGEYIFRGTSSPFLSLNVQVLDGNKNDKTRKLEMQQTSNSTSTASPSSSGFSRKEKNLSETTSRSLNFATTRAVSPASHSVGSESSTGSSKSLNSTEANQIFFTNTTYHKLAKDQKKIHAKGGMEPGEILKKQKDLWKQEKKQSSSKMPLSPAAKRSKNDSEEAKALSMERAHIKAMASAKQKASIVLRQKEEEERRRKGGGNSVVHQAAASSAGERKAGVPASGNNHNSNGKGSANGNGGDNGSGSGSVGNNSGGPNSPNSGGNGNGGNRGGNGNNHSSPKTPASATPVSSKKKKAKNVTPANVKRGKVTIHLTPDFEFKPANVTVARNSTVTFILDDGVMAGSEHQVVGYDSKDVLTSPAASPNKGRSGKKGEPGQNVNPTAAFRSPVLQRLSRKTSYSFKVGEGVPKNLEYMCDVNNEMKGRITVVDDEDGSAGDGGVISSTLNLGIEDSSSEEAAEEVRGSEERR